VRFLADESCDFNVVKALRAAGFEIVPIAEVSPVPPMFRSSNWQSVKIGSC